MASPGLGGTEGEMASSGLCPAPVGTSRPFFQSKYEQVQKNLGEVQKQLEEAQQKIQLNDLERSHTGRGEQAGTLGVGCWWEKLPFMSFIHS